MEIKRNSKEICMKKRLLISFFALVLVLSCTACSRKFSGYTVYHQDVGQGLFTIEYPDNYDIPLVELYNDTQYSCIHLKNRLDRESRAQSIWEIEITRQKYDSLSDAIIQQMRLFEVYPDSELTTQYDVDIDGNKATVLTCTYTKALTDYEMNILKLKPIRLQATFAYFSKNGAVWRIADTTCPDVFPNDPEYFQHMLDTMIVRY